MVISILLKITKTDYFIITKKEFSMQRKETVILIGWLGLNENYKSKFLLLALVVWDLRLHNIGSFDESIGL